ncbi:hypothetical protein BB561_001029, partial [Smittium simulii]
MRFIARFLLCVTTTILIQSSLVYFVESHPKLPFVKGRNPVDYLASRGNIEGADKKCTGILVSPNVVITTENCANAKLVRINPDLTDKHNELDNIITVQIETTNHNGKNSNYVVDKSILIPEFNIGKNYEDKVAMLILKNCVPETIELLPELDAGSFDESKAYLSDGLINFGAYRKMNFTESEKRILSEIKESSQSLSKMIIADVRSANFLESQIAGLRLVTNQNSKIAGLLGGVITETKKCESCNAELKWLSPENYKMSKNQKIVGLSFILLEPKLSILIRNTICKENLCNTPDYCSNTSAKKSLKDYYRSAFNVIKNYSPLLAPFRSKESITSDAKKNNLADRQLYKKSKKIRLNKRDNVNAYQLPSKSSSTIPPNSSTKSSCTKSKTTPNISSSSKTSTSPSKSVDSTSESTTSSSKTSTSPSKSVDSTSESTTSSSKTSTSPSKSVDSTSESTTSSSKTSTSPSKKYPESPDYPEYPESSENTTTSPSKSVDSTSESTTSTTDHSTSLDTTTTLSITTCSLKTKSKSSCTKTTSNPVDSTSEETTPSKTTPSSEPEYPETSDYPTEPAYPETSDYPTEPDTSPNPVDSTSEITTSSTCTNKLKTSTSSCTNSTPESYPVDSTSEETSPSSEPEYPETSDYPTEPAYPETSDYPTEPDTSPNPVDSTKTSDYPTEPDTSPNPVDSTSEITTSSTCTNKLKTSTSSCTNSTPESYPVDSTSEVKTPTKSTCTSTTTVTEPDITVTITTIITICNSVPEPPCTDCTTPPTNPVDSTSEVPPTYPTEPPV